MEKDCWFRNKDEVNFCEKNDSSDQLFFTCLSSHHEYSQDIWYMDSGCSSHMIGNRNCFVSLDEKITSQVKLGDGKLHDVKGKGVISVQTKRGKSKLMHDVLYVPGLTQNLLSVGQLMKKGYKMIFD